MRLLFSPLQWALCGSLVFLAGTSAAVETTLAIDSTLAGVASTPGNFFLAGEKTAVWLTSSCEGDIVAAQVYWTSLLGGNPASLETDITIHAAGIHPVPGAIRTNLGGANAVIALPQLADMAMNEFRHLDPPTNSQALSIPVSNNETFAVSFQHANTNSGIPLASAVGLDTDGCQPGLSAAFAIPGGWADACTLGVTGDWVMRAVVDCDETSVPAAGPGPRVALVLLLLFAGALTAHCRCYASS